MDGESPPLWQVPRPSRDDRVFGGVASGIAYEIGVDALLVRVAFVVLALAGGLGVVLYLVAWVVMENWPTASETAARVPQPKARDETTRLVAFGLVVVGLLLLARAFDAGFVDGIVWPVALLGVGVAVALHRGVHLEAIVGERSGGLLVRAGAGVALATMGVVLAVSLNFDLRAAWDTLLVVGLVVAGLALVLAPWGVRLARDLAEERRRRIRSEERAEVAAHLHDSVLQTLALIQRRAGEPEVVSLARSQERELRSWLFGRGAVGAAGGFRSRLEVIAAEVEQLHAVPVEVVVVGDVFDGGAADPLLAAAREAISNAARHAEATRIDVFAEVAPDAIDVFVRDQGTGFDPADVPPDRRGIAESIRGRMQRAGGTATIESRPGHGTEVELHLDLEVEGDR